MTAEPVEADTPETVHTITAVPDRPDAGAEVAEVADEPTLDAMMEEYGEILVYEAEFTKFKNAKKKALYEKQMAAREATGGAAKSFAHTFGPKAKVTFTLKDVEDSIVVDRKERFEDWVLDNHPTEATTVVQVEPAFQTSLLKRLVAVEVEAEDGTKSTQIIDPETGNIVEGVCLKKGGAPTSFGTSWSGDGKKIALERVIGRTVDALPLISIESGQ
jgi:hypothetical protein